MDSEHFPYPVDPPDRQTDRCADPAQDAQLIYLRQHGKYLTPGRGIDIVSAIAVVLRGVLLNLLVWLPIAALVLFLLMMLVPAVDMVLPFVALGDRFPSVYGWMAFVSAVAALIFAVFAVIYSLMTYHKVLAVIYSLMTYCTKDKRPWRYMLRRFVDTKIRYVLWTIVVTLPVALLPVVKSGAQDWLSSLGVASIVTGVASAVGIFRRSRSGSNEAGLTMSIIAPLGAVLSLYGLLILGYVWAERFSWHACSYAHSGAYVWAERFLWYACSYAHP